jgi:hypothetical protein
VQNGFDRGLIGQGAGRIQQSSISIFSAPHDLGALLPQLGYIILAISFGELNPETRCELDRAAEFHRHWQVEFPPCLETSIKNPYV